MGIRLTQPLALTPASWGGPLGGPPGPRGTPPSRCWTRREGLSQGDAHLRQSLYKNAAAPN